MENNKKSTMELQEKNYSRDEENRIIVNMSVKDDSEFLSVFSASETPVISSEVAEFLENSVHSVPVKEQLTLRIKSDCIDDEEKEIYKTAIKQYYFERNIASQRELKRCNFLALCLAVLGVLVLAFAVYLDYAMTSVIWAEVVDIVAWVFLWEAVDVSFFKTMELRQKMKRYQAFIDMKIEYQSLAYKEI